MQSLPLPLAPVPLALVVPLVPLVAVALPAVPDCICICKSQFWKSASSDPRPSVLPLVVEVPEAVELPPWLSATEKSGTPSVPVVPEEPVGEEDPKEGNGMVQGLPVTAPIDMGAILAWFVLPD
ncbi:MAG TPA: hypothetical protein VMF62_02730 [Acetobacteraceae bacterium]|nr:hypothetical protein [Acetobacteraceae bacterium]